MTLDNFFENKNLINLPDLDQFGIEHEVITEITARDLKTDSLITAYKDEEGEVWFAFIYPNKIVCRNYFIESKRNDLVTGYGIDLILQSCGFEKYDCNQYRRYVNPKELLFEKYDCNQYRYANPKELLFEIDAKLDYDNLVFNKVVEYKKEICKIDYNKMIKSNIKVTTNYLTYNDLLNILEELLEQKVLPFIEQEEKIDDEQDCVYFNDECLTKEEYLELLWTKLVDFDSYLAYESLFDITNQKLTLDEKIIEIESKIVDVFLREYEEQSIHDFLKEKIIEKVLID